MSVTADLEACLGRIAAQDGALKSFITVGADSARLAAAALDAAETRLPLHGLLLGVKDLADTAEMRTTYGSSLYANHRPASDDLIVARARAAGAVIVGKTNTPEFGFGAVCTNRLCGPTANPLDLALTSGGSSGGSAAAVAAGLVPAALGSDFGGSVRTPAAFCGIVGFRPTPGRLPAPGRGLAWDGLSTAGFLTKAVSDSRWLLEVLEGPERADPISERAWPVQGTGRRLAASADFGGVAPVAQAVRAGFEEALAELRLSGRAAPDCTAAPAVFATLRAAVIRHNLGPLLERHGEALMPTVRWNIEQGEGISAGAYLAAEAARSRLYRDFLGFFGTYDFLVTPAASVLPFPSEQGEVTEIDGRPLPSLIDYLLVTSIISLVGCPAVSIPYWPRGAALPIGLQLVAAPGQDYALLEFAEELQALRPHRGR